MTALTPTPVAPPRWAEQCLRALLPKDSMRDAIIGDLHEEFVRDAACVGTEVARVRYRLRVAGIVAYVVIDMARWRPWSGGPVPVPAAAVPVALPPGRALLGRADLGLIAAAFCVLGVGIIANTVLFARVRHVPNVAPVTTSALGVVALLLSLGCAALAAVMLCVGPRWLRRRACREDAARRAVETGGTLPLQAAADD